MPSEPRTRALVLRGTAVIAVCYGLGRYAYGLFVPQFQEALALSGTQIGVIGGLSHAGYAVGLLAAPSTSRRYGPGRSASIAAGAAGLGLGCVAVSVGPTTLGLAILIAGLGSGLASPSLAQVVVGRLDAAERSPTQTWINSGTSFGLAVSAPAVLLTTDWRSTWALFAVVALTVAVSSWPCLGHGDPMPRPRPATGFVGAASGALLTYTFTLGATSAGYWTFARQRVLDAGSSDAWSVGFWITIGLFGLLGGSAGALASRIGLRRALQFWGLVWASALGALALPGLSTPVALVSAGGFGAAYMALTGLAIIWAVRVYRDDASTGVRAAFLTLGAGQATGTPLVGLLADAWGLPATFAFSATASVALLLSASLARDRQHLGRCSQGTARLGRRGSRSPSP